MKRDPKLGENSSITVSAAELGGYLDCSERNIRDLAKRGIIPPANNGQFPLLLSISLYVAHLQEKMGIK